MTFREKAPSPFFLPPLVRVCVSFFCPLLVIDSGGSIFLVLCKHFPRSHRALLRPPETVVLEFYNTFPFCGNGLSAVLAFRFAIGYSRLGFRSHGFSRMLKFLPFGPQIPTNPCAHTEQCCPSCGPLCCTKAPFESLGLCPFNIPLPNFLVRIIHLASHFLRTPF